MVGSEDAIRSATVLVVDDEAFMRNFLERLLKTIGVKHILTAEDGWRGLKTLAEYNRRIDVVILDVHMPVLDGFGFLRRVRSETSPCRDLPVLVLTGDHDEVVVRDCAALGVQGFVVKPIDIESLRQRLKSTLRRAARHSHTPA